MIPNRFMSLRVIWNLSLLFHFRNPVWILNICKIHKTPSLTLEYGMKILMLQLLHTIHWVIFSAPIYTLNSENAIFSKCGRHLILLSLLHCSYIWIKKSMYSRFTSNLLMSFLILPTQEGSCWRQFIYGLISYAISSLASWSLVLSNFSWSHLQYISSETKFLMLKYHLNLWTHFSEYLSSFNRHEEM